MSKNTPNCKFKGHLGMGKDVFKCATQPSFINCGKPITKLAFDPCMQQHMMHQTMNDPYYQHMPKNDPAAATLYAARMGGEHHDGCEIM